MARARLRSSLSIVALFLLLGVELGYGQSNWVGSWATSPFLADGNYAQPQGELNDATLRQVVHLSLGGSELRVHFSNRDGAAPLHFSSVHIARAEAPGSARIVAGTDQALAFSGKPDVTLPPGADYVSDPIKFSAAPLSDLAITLHLEQQPEKQTGHRASHATSFLVHGNQVSAADLPDARKVERWYFLAGVDVLAPSNAAAVVTLGDSITDGTGSTTDKNNRWPDDLARRLQAAPGKKNIAVLNQGIGGNRLLLDGAGPNTLARFNHDVLAQAGARYVIVLEAINDISHLPLDTDDSPAANETLVHNITASYEQIIARAHTHGMKVFGATLTPFGGSAAQRRGPHTEANRQAVNQWIRTSGKFDGVIDLDKSVRDPEHPDQMLPKYDSGDHLHPSPEGYAAMAAAVGLSLF